MKDITFDLPKGVQIPDGKQVGDTFQAMTTYEIEAGGKVCLREVDGEPLDPKWDESDEPNDSGNDDSTDSGPSPMTGGMRNALMGGG